MSTAALAEKVVRAKGWLTNPRKGLGPAWLIVVAVMLMTRSPLLSGFVLASCLAGWLSMLLIALVIPPPPKLSETSALLARLMGFGRVVWASFVFTGSAIFGVLVSLTLDPAHILLAGDGGLSYEWQHIIGPVVVVVATAMGWYTAMACAYDLWRAGEYARTRSLIRTGRRVLPADLRRHDAVRWIYGVILAFTRGWLPWALGYFAPVIWIAVVDLLPTLAA